MRTTYITREDLVQELPLLTSKRPTRTVSDKYQHTPTINFIDLLMFKGWCPYDHDVRGEGESAFCKHSVSLRNPKFTRKITPKESVTPSVTIVNSYDGLYTTRFYYEFYSELTNMKLNVAYEGEFYAKLNHSVGNMDNIEGFLDEVLKSVLEVYKDVYVFVDKKMPSKDRENFAAEAFKLRSTNPVDDKIISALLETDHIWPNSVWATLSTVHQKIINGFSVKDEKLNKLSKYRRITSFEKKLDLSSAIYKMIV